MPELTVSEQGRGRVLEVLGFGVEWFGVRGYRIEGLRPEDPEE